MAASVARSNFDKLNATAGRQMTLSVKAIQMALDIVLRRALCGVGNLDLSLALGSYA
jgi:hypothetical protein